MLRITNSMMVNDLKRNMNTNMLRMAELQLQLSSGRKINKPSDDPAGIVTSLRLRSNLVESEQFRRNIDEAASFMQTTDDAMSMINEIMHKINELTVKAATGTNNPSSQEAIAQEILELNEQLKIAANTTYGNKYIFGGTNTTQAPSQNGLWRGNDDLIQLEIGVGVKIPINLKTKGYFSGSLNNLNINSSSGIKQMEAQNLQEGKYTVKTLLGSPVNSTAAEAHSYLGAIGNNNKFFYQDASTAATLGAGRMPVPPAGMSNDSAYNSSLMIEVKEVKTSVPANEPSAGISGAAAAPILTFDRDLYIRDADNELQILPSSDLLSSFTYTPASGAASLTAADYDSTTHAVSFTIAGGPAEGDTIIWNNNTTGTDQNKIFSVDEKAYQPVKAVFKDGNWIYDDAAKVVADIKGHVYNAGNGSYKYIELVNTQLNMEAAGGQAIFTIPSSAFNRADGSADPDFPDDLIIWNNGGTLGGIDPINPQIAVGDKTVISTAAQGDGVSSERVNIGCTYEDQYGKSLGERTHSFVFGADYFDYSSKDLKFFTLDEQTGLTYDGVMKLTSHDFATSDDIAEPSNAFDYKAGLFAYVNSLANKISIGKLPQVGNELAGQDERMQELLMYRSMLGARINRLELQTNRLTKTEESLTGLLSANEDANEAEVIMDLQMQENVYQASLAAGARIIQPSLLDFLR